MFNKSVFLNLLLITAFPLLGMEANSIQPNTNDDHEIKLTDIQRIREQFRTHIKEQYHPPFLILKITIKTLHFFNCAPELTVAEAKKNREFLNKYLAKENEQKRTQAIDQLGTNPLDLTIINMHFKWRKNNRTPAFPMKTFFKTLLEESHLELCTYLGIPESTSYKEAITKGWSLPEEKLFNFYTISFFKHYICSEGEQHLQQKNIVARIKNKQD